MPIACRNKQIHGKTYCVTDCPTRAENSPLEYVRVLAPSDLPPAHPRVIDVPILDMNYGWPNLGHDSIVHAVMDAGCDLIPQLHEAGLRIRVLVLRGAPPAHDPGGPGALLALPRDRRAGPHRPAPQRRAARAARASRRIPPGSRSSSACSKTSGSTTRPLSSRCATRSA